MACILLVSENHEQLENLEKGLMKIPGTSIRKAVSADGVIALIGKKPVDLAIVDETVSGITAKQLIELMIMVNPAINTAMISSLPDDDFHEKTEGLGILMRLPPNPAESVAADVIDRLDKVISLNKRIPPSC